MMKALKILLVGDYPADPTQGSAKVYDKLAHSLSARGHQVRVLRRPDLGLWPRGRYGRELCGPWLVWRALHQQFQQQDWDVVDVASAEGWIWGKWKSAGILVSRSHGWEHLNYARVLSDARAGLRRKAWWQRWWYPLIRMKPVEWAARGADGLIVLNPGDADFAITRGWQAPDRVRIIPHGVDRNFLEILPDWSSRDGDIMFCGSWDSVKGVESVVGAFVKLADEDPSRHLTVVGADDCDTVLGRFPARIRSQVTVRLRCSEEEVRAEYRRHRIFVFASTYEGFGLTLVEAMSQGMAVVATPVGAASTLVQDGLTGLSIPLRNATALAEAWRRLGAEPGLAERLGLAARDRVVGLTWDRTAQQTESFYQELLDQGEKTKHGAL